MDDVSLYIACYTRCVYYNNVIHVYCNKLVYYNTIWVVIMPCFIIIERTSFIIILSLLQCIICYNTYLMTPFSLWNWQMLAWLSECAISLPQHSLRSMAFSYHFSLWNWQILAWWPQKCSSSLSQHHFRNISFCILKPFKFLRKPTKAERTTYTLKVEATLEVL